MYNLIKEPALIYEENQCIDIKIKNLSGLFNFSDSVSKITLFDLFH